MEGWPNMTPILVSYLVDDPGWHGKVIGFRWDLYEAIGREQEQAQEQAAQSAEVKYSPDAIAQRSRRWREKHARRRERKLA